MDSTLANALTNIVTFFNPQYLLFLPPIIGIFLPYFVVKYVERRAKKEIK